ncbi:putative ankyrin repeat domain-containing protein 40-like [Apostichopus japonicus]|uniref:Putative ankyrin repeat domain-containing protein 40-like n=1 Tax=Stichopus japonicus TaxID=307972 RepID=A0A2G8K9A9_STIJA|nr:putative ankyrin repeat domain-containing protein 40-like [Apostichopus japonicus]
MNGNAEVNERLREAAALGNEDLIQELVKQGADVNSRNHMNGWTSLHWACRRNHPHAVQLLVQLGADPSLPNDKDELPNQLTAVEAIHDVLELVLKVRIARTNDSDFIEVELKRNSLTYQTLVEKCCEELEVDAKDVVKVRKLPNTVLRKDKDVQRLEDFQELELVVQRRSAAEAYHLQIQQMDLVY